MPTTTAPPPAATIWRDPDHRYHHPTGGKFRSSVTGVLSWQKSPQALAAIEATRKDWEPRGNATHSALELWAAIALGQSPWDAARRLQALQDGPYAQWIRPLLSHPLWTVPGVEIIASEQFTYCLTRSIAGAFDLAITHPTYGRVLLDLKTQGRFGASPYDVRPQLGGYLALELTHGRRYDAAAVIWARPNACSLGMIHWPDECLTLWAAAVATWAAMGRPEDSQRPFDPFSAPIGQPSMAATAQPQLP